MDLFLLLSDLVFNVGRETFLVKVRLYVIQERLRREVYYWDL